MKSILSIASDNRGVAIVAVTMVLVVVALMGGAIISQTSQDTQLSNRALEDKRALYIAESAKEFGYEQIKADENFVTAATGEVPFQGEMQGGSYTLWAREISPAPDKVVGLIGTGFTNSGNMREVNVVADVIRENVVVWNNAIFGGAGQVGGVINGNAAIHGSVHLLGENVADGNNSIAALDMSGASLIHNNYTGIPPALAAKLPALPTTNYGGEEIGSIDAKLRVKNGAVGVSGSSEIGEMNILGNAFKETMDGIYIETDHSETRWTGTQVVDGSPNPDHVQSDNGYNALYDLGDAVQMPSFFEPFEDPFSGIMYASYEAYFSDQALHLPAMVFDNTSSAADAVRAHQAAGGFPPDVVVNFDPANPDSFTITDPRPDGTANQIAYNPNAANGVVVLGINQMVQFDGDVVLGKKNLDIMYGGEGTIYAAGDGVNSGNLDASGDGVSGSGNIDVHSDLLPIGTFPTVTVLGVMARSDINLATGPGDSQLTMAGAFFAGNQIVSAKQNNIAGTFVAPYFNMGTNVPRIYQVPALKDNLPPGLIASAPIWVVTGFDEKSWQAEDSPMVMSHGYGYSQYPGGYPPDGTGY